MIPDIWTDRRLLFTLQRQIILSLPPLQLLNTMRFTLYYVEALTQICLMIIFNARSASAAFLSKREAVTDWNEVRTAK